MSLAHHLSNRRLHLEHLEDRRCFTGNVLAPNPGYTNTAPKPTMTVYQGELRIAGTAYADTVTVANYDLNLIKFTASNQFGSTSALYSKTYFSAVRFDAGDGVDTFKNSTSLSSIVYGGAGGDFLYGGNAADKLYGEGGDDYIEGRAGDDTIEGGLNSDTVWGQAGTDTIRGGDGIDYLHGGTERDFIYGQKDGDFIWGDEGDDVLEGGEDDDEMWGGIGSDTMHGRKGNDILWGEADNDFLFGDEDFDQLHGGTEDDRLEGGYDGVYDYLWGDEGVDTFVRYVIPSWYYDENLEMVVQTTDIVEQDAEIDFDTDQVEEIVV